MKLLTVKTIWGVTPLMGNAPGRYADVFARIKSDGFGAIETPIWKIEDPVSFAAALKSTGLDYVAMVNTRTPENLPGSHALTRSVDAHLASFEAQIRQALTSLPGVRPLFVTSHSGVDAWGPADARAFFDGALRIEKEIGIMVCHETHRGRVLYNPWVTRDLCREFPKLHLTADLTGCASDHPCFESQALQMGGQVDHDRGFAGAAYQHVAHHPDGNGQWSGGTPAQSVTQTGQQQPGAADKRQRPQQTGDEVAAEPGFAQQSGRVLHQSGGGDVAAGLR